MTDDIRPDGPPDPEDGGGPDVDNDVVLEDPEAETPAGVEP